MNDSEFLNWLTDRLIYVYKESPNVDFVHKLRAIANAKAREPEVGTFKAGLDAAADYLIRCGDYGDQAKADEIRKLALPAGGVREVDIEALTYRVANAKLGEGPSVRCEGPTDFEKDQARAWVKRVLAALSPATAKTETKDD